MNSLNSPIVAILLGQFMVLLGAAGYLRRVVKDHDRQLEDHEKRIREVEQRKVRGHQPWRAEPQEEY